MTTIEAGSRSSAEDDEEEKDKGETKDTSGTSKTRRMPGVSFWAEKERIADRKEQEVVRIINSLFKEKDPKSKEEAEDHEKEPATDSETSDSSILEPEALRIDSWEEEGEFDDEDAEISLQRRVTEVVNTDENEPDVPEETLEEAERVAPATAEENTESPEPETAAGSGGETPPPDTPEDVSEDEPDHRGPSPRSTSSGDGGDSRFTPSDSERVSFDARAYEEELNDAEYYGERRGQRHGVVAGLATGLYIGHRRKKTQGKQYENKLDDKDKEIKKLRSEQYTTEERIGALRRANEKSRLELAEQAKNRPMAPLEAPVAHNEAATPFVASILEGNKSRASAETRSAHAHEKPTSKELPPEDREITEETYVTQEGRRVESSSWHRIEIDAKTGQAVEDPEVRYGEEFKRERQQEILAAAKADNHAAAVQLGSMATTASTQHHTAGQAHSSQAASGSFKPSDTPDSPFPVIKTAHTKQSVAQDPIVWAAGMALVVILILLAILF